MAKMLLSLFVVLVLLQLTQSSTTVPKPSGDSADFLVSTHSPATSPITDSLASSPITDSLTTSPITDCLTTSSISDSLTTSPITDSLTTSPITDSLTTSPITDSLPTSPITDSLTTSPITDSLPTSPITDSLPTSPITDSLPTSPITDSLTTSPITNSPHTSPSATSNSVTNPDSNPGFLSSLFTFLFPSNVRGFCSRILFGTYSFMNANPIGCSVLLALAINRWNMPLPSTSVSGADISDHQLLAGLLSIFLVTFLRVLMFLALRYIVWRR